MTPGNEFFDLEEGMQEGSFAILLPDLTGVAGTVFFTTPFQASTSLAPGDSLSVGLSMATATAGTAPAIAFVLQTQDRSGVTGAGDNQNWYDVNGAAITLTSGAAPVSAFIIPGARQDVGTKFRLKMTKANADNTWAGNDVTGTVFSTRDFAAAA